MHYDEQREELYKPNLKSEILSHLKQELGILERQGSQYVIGSYELRSYQLRIKSNKILTEKVEGAM